MRQAYPVPFINSLVHLAAFALLAAIAAGTIDSVRDPHSPARFPSGFPHMLTPPPRLSGIGVGPARILLVGADDRDSRGRADTIIVAYLNPRSNRAALLSIQRDTLVDIPGHRRDKINHAYKFGGVPLLKTCVERLVGQSLDGYVKLDFETFEECVDKLGGVEITVGDPEGRGRGMNYDDNAGKLHIHLKPGKQTLNGKQAIGFVRYRKDSDIMRAERQREFLKAVVRQHFRPSGWPRTIGAAKHAIRKVDTDIPLGRALAIATALKGIKPEDIMTEMLPVEPAPAHGVYYSRVDEAKAQELLAKLREFLQGEKSNTVSVKDCGVVVLNGSGKTGAAKRLADRLRAEGVLVTGVGNAEDSGHSRSEIRYHPASRGAAEEIRQMLGAASARLIEDEDFDAPGAAGIVVTVGRDIASGDRTRD